MVDGLYEKIFRIVLLLLVLFVSVLWVPVKLNDGTTYPYGFGWELGSFKGQKMVYHGGGGPGIRTKFARFVDSRLSIIVLINLDDVDVDSIVYGVAALYL